MALLTKRLAALCVLSAAFVYGIFWILSPAPVERDPPRPLPWTLPDYRKAKTDWVIGADGRIHTHVEHFTLQDISPEMVSWFYQQLPISTVELDGRRMPLYHIFHPSEHGTIRVIEPAPDGEPGMAKGAMIERIEWFGPFDSQGAARIVEQSSRGMLAIPEFAGIQIGEVRHSFTAVPEGTAYEVNTVIGSDIPLLGAVINWYLRTRVFHPAMLEQWRRHQVEEVASLQFFLRDIYEQRGGGNHFVLER